MSDIDINSGDNSAGEAFNDVAVDSGNEDGDNIPKDVAKIESVIQQSTLEKGPIDTEKNEHILLDDKEIDLDAEKKTPNIATTTSIDQEKPQSQKEYKQLAVATAVSFESSSEFLGKKKQSKRVAIATAEKYDPEDDGQETSFCRRYAIVWGGCSILGILLVVLLTVLLMPIKDKCSIPSFCQDGNPLVTNAPTDSPTKSTRESKITNYLVKQFSPNILVAGTPYAMALDWILYRDLLNVDIGIGFEPRYLRTRFALAVFYYSTTGSGSRHWRSCGEPMPQYNNHSCTYLEPYVLPDGVSVAYNEQPGTRWLSSSDHCVWKGVVCDEVKGLSVLRIDVGGQGIQGNLGGVLKGDADDTIVTNILLRAFPGLQVLDMSFNELTGSLPPSFASFSSLVALELHFNSLTGEIPVSYFENLLSLQLLNLGDNQFKGVLNTRIGQLTDLRGLHLLRNNFDGTIPSEIGNLARFLTHSRIDENEFSGQLPTELGRLSNVVQFEYSNNLFTVSNAYARDKNRMRYSFIDSTLTFGSLFILQGTIPRELGQLTNMDIFRLDSNQLTGTIPVELCNMSNARLLRLDNNELSGPLPTIELLKFQRLQIFQVSKNQLTGPIPAQLGSIPGLLLAWLHLNQFTGEVPIELCQAASIDGTGLSILQADCPPIDNPPNACRCCTACCDRSTEVCLASR